MHIKKTCTQGLKLTLFTASSGTFLSHTGILVFCSKFFICWWRIHDERGWAGYHCPRSRWSAGSFTHCCIAFSANSNTVGKSDWRPSALVKPSWCCRITKRVFGFLDHTLRTARVDGDTVPRGLWFTSWIQGKAPTGGSEFRCISNTEWACSNSYFHPESHSGALEVTGDTVAS